MTQCIIFNLSEVLIIGPVGIERVHIAVNERSPLEIIDCAACQVPEAYVPHQ
jgi:hypothetical protein